MIMTSTTGRRAAAAFVAVISVAGILFWVGGADSATESTITAGALERSLERSGLQITPRSGRPRTGLSEVIAGIAHGARGARVEFEFAVSKDPRASTTQLGTVGIPIKRSGPNQNRPDSVRLGSGILVTPVIRGVLGNVAYALYYFGVREAPPDATRDVVRRLDTALFDAFPATDTEAHAILPRP
jgi:hypothetical protein